MPTQRDPDKVQMTFWMLGTLRDRFKAKAAERKETSTAALIRFMEWYVGDRSEP